MIELRKRQKDLDLSGFDYVFEDAESFEDVLPYLLPKLEGKWSIILLDPKLQAVRTFLDTTIVPSYVVLTIIVEQRQLEQLYLERPSLVKKEKSNWDRYMDLLKEFPVPMEDKAMRELYFRCGPKEKDLQEALGVLLDCSYVTLAEVNKHFAPVQRVYASQVVKAFLLMQYPRAWKMLAILERELGTTIAFYAMRKNIRAVYEAKCKYLKNEDVKERLVTAVDTYTIIRLYWWFEVSTPEQLYILLAMYERGEVPCYMEKE